MGPYIFVIAINNVLTNAIVQLDSAVLVGQRWILYWLYFSYDQSEVQQVGGYATGVCGQ